MTLRYGTVCSGIEAASQAWQPLGWQPVFFSEIEPFPCAVLAHHHGSNLPGEPHASNGVPNYGDMTRFQEWPDHGPLSDSRIDLLAGGTPCQSFSIAGLRKGLDDQRGNLSLTFGALAARYRPRWLVWENVPGVLSSNGGRDFASILGLLAGRCITVPDGGWKNAGSIEGYHAAYGLAWRVLDAQYVRVDGFGRAVPQRRRRVVLVGHLGNAGRARAVLFERESVSGHPAPRRQAGQRPAPTISVRPTGGGGLGTDFDLDGGLIAADKQALGAYGDGDVASTVSARDFKDATDLVAHTLLAKENDSHAADLEAYVAHSLRAEGFDASEDGTGRGTPLVPILFDCKACRDTSFAVGEIPSALRGVGHGGGHSAIAIQERAVSENPDTGPDGAGVRTDGAAYTLEARPRPQAVAHGLTTEQTPKYANDVALTLTKQSPTGGGQPQAVAFAENSRSELRLCGGDGEVSAQLTTGGGKPGQGQPVIAEAWAVRRLTPRECERLQGFPDDHTAIAWRGKPPENCPDGPRYKALGNSWPVNMFRWVGVRIAMVEELIAEGLA